MASLTNAINEKNHQIQRLEQDIQKENDLVRERSQSSGSDISGKSIGGSRGTNSGIKALRSSIIGFDNEQVIFNNLFIYFTYSNHNCNNF